MPLEAGARLKWKSAHQQSGGESYIEALQAAAELIRGQKC